MNTPQEKPSGRPRRLTASLALAALLLTTGLGIFAGPRPAQAQWIVSDVTASAQKVADDVKTTVKDMLIEGVITAVANGVNYFTTQLAYQLAMAIVQECPGQKPCWDTMSFGDMVENAGKGALGEAIGTLRDEGGFAKLGLDLCAPSASFTLRLQLGLLETEQPAAAKCDFNDIVNNWESAVNSLSWDQLKEHQWASFEPGGSPLGVAFQINSRMAIKINEDRAAKAWQRLSDYAGGGGFVAVQDPVSKRVQAPSAFLKSKFDEREEAKKKGERMSESLTAGAIARGTILQIVANTAQTFGRTLMSAAWNKLVRGLLSPEEAAQAQPEVVLSSEGVVAPTTSQTSVSMQTRTLLPPIVEAGSYDPLTEFATCPQQYAGPNNCVLDSQFSSAIRVAAGGAGLTVREALKKGMLHGDWPLISAADTARNTQDWCYTVGYCESNLKKLRAARIIPIGWEIAASKSPTGKNAVKLKDVVDGFDDCNSEGEADESHKWCHLIDPDWVLKQPLGQCRATAYTAHLESADGPNRLQMCVDPVTCLREDDFGNCIGGWGYCTRERNVWRFNADSCPSEYNTCRQLTPASGGSAVSLLLNTIDYGSCNADNVGCTRYAIQQNAVSCELSSACKDATGCLCSVTDSCDVPSGERYCLTADGTACDLLKYANKLSCDSAPCTCQVSRSCRVDQGSKACVSSEGDTSDKSDDWLTTPAIFLNAKAKSCSSNDAGCSELVKLTTGQSLNLVRNSEFSTLEDGDGDGISDHPRYWSPFGKVPAGTAASPKPGEIISSGIVLTDSHNSGTCPDSGPLSACTSALGCPCTTSTGYSCKIPHGRSSCPVTSRVMQIGIPVRQDGIHTLSVTFTSDVATDGKQGVARLYFVNAAGKSVTLNSNYVSTTYSSGVDNCTVANDATGSYLRLLTEPLTTTSPTTVSCTFTVSQAGNVQPIVEADLELRSTCATCADPTGVTADEVQLEEGGGTSHHTGYGNATTNAYLKAPPDYLGCSGETDDPDICDKYAMVCRANEVGCRSYSPANGDPSVPAIVSQNDYCPASCEGYDMYKQEKSEFESAEKFPVYMIPSAATSCTESEVGCSEFTDIQTEAVSYYSRLRICEQPDQFSGQEVGTFYTWEGSDTTGYQLKTWRLKPTEADITVSGTAGLANDSDSNFCETGSCPGTQLNQAPCTKLSATNPEQCDDAATAGVCDADDTATNLDCREFYDADGNRYFRLQSRTIAVTTDCKRLRISQSTQTDCEGTNGSWDLGQQVCIYGVLPSDSRSCSQAVNGCRSYKGNTAADTRQLFLTDFESTPLTSATSSNGKISAESVTAGGKSYKLEGNQLYAREVGGNVAHGRLYSMQFWAKGSGTVNFQVRETANAVDIECDIDKTTCSGGNCTCTTAYGDSCSVSESASSPTCSITGTGTSSITFGPYELSGDWRQYDIGPFDPADQSLPSNWGHASVEFAVVAGAGATAYIDNVVVREVRDSFTVVRDSWTIPAVCDQTADGAYSQYEMIGCRKYTDDLNKTAYLRSFTSLCREQAVGCTAYSRTYEEDSHWPKTYNAVCSLGQDSLGKDLLCDQALAGSAATSCRCDYELRHPAVTSGSLYLGDVCRVPFGSNECRFTLDGRAKLTDLANDHDSYLLPADSRVYLVPSNAASCQSTAAGCTALGKSSATFEGKCTLPSSNSPCDPANEDTNEEKNGKYCLCTDSETGNICRVEEGNKTCTFAAEEEQIESWKTTAVKQDPDSFGQQLCLEDEVGCQAYKASDGTFYFKDPGNQVCQYKKSVTYQNETRSGWFRKSASGENFPCYPELLKDGNFFAIYKNADPSCTLDEACDQAAGCPCTKEINGTDTTICYVVRGYRSCGYAGWAGQCEATYDRCEEFVDPSQTSANNPDGEPYYYIANEKLDTSTCAGNVNLKQGCVLFDKTSDKRTLFSSSASYQKSKEASAGASVTVSAVNCDVNNRSSYCNNRCFHYENGTCASDPNVSCLQDSDCVSTGVTPTGGECKGREVYGWGCSTDADCDASNEEICVSDPDETLTTAGTASTDTHDDSLGRAFTRNDSNVIIKVAPDRECGAWLACSQQEVSWDSDANKWRLTCTDFGLCTENSEAGQASECVTWEQQDKEILTEKKYTGRDVSWRGQDYAGFSLFKKYPPQYLTPVKVNQGICYKLNTSPPQATTSPPTYCRSSEDCGASAYCSTPLKGVCVVPGSNTGDLKPCDCTSSTNTCSTGYCSCSDLIALRFGINLDKKYCQDNVSSDTCSDDSGCDSDEVCIDGNCADSCDKTSDCASGSCVTASCDTDSDCPKEPDTGKAGRCYQGHCWVDFAGGPLKDSDRLAGPSCRAYPEEDSPYGVSVLQGGTSGYDDDTGEAVDKVTAFANANVCIQNNDCECSYEKVNYGPGSGYARFYSFTPDTNQKLPYSKTPSSSSKPVSYCVSGDYNGRPCRSTGGASGAIITAKTCQDGGGTCSKATRATLAYGWPGFCIDYDRSTNINNDQALYGCNLWLPVDQLSGLPNRWNQYKEAGWNPPAGVSQINFCAVGEGNAKYAGPDKYTKDIYSKQPIPFAPTVFCAENGNTCSQYTDGSSCNGAPSYGDPCAGDYDEEPCKSLPNSAKVSKSGCYWTGTSCVPAVYFQSNPSTPVTDCNQAYIQSGVNNMAPSEGPGLGWCDALNVCKGNIGSKWFDVDWEDWESDSHTTEVSGLGTVYKHQIAAIEIVMEGPGSGISLFLTPDESDDDHDFSAACSWNGNNDPNTSCYVTIDPWTQTTTSDGKLHVAGYLNRKDIDSDNRGDCDDWLRLIEEGKGGDIENNYCEPYDGTFDNCLGALAVFDNSGKLTNIRSGLCHNASTVSHNVRVDHVYVHLRENCSEVNNVYGGGVAGLEGSSAWPGAPYTDKLFDAQSSTPSGFADYNAQTKRPDLSDKSLAPLGRSNPDGILTSPEMIGSRTLPISIYDSENGSKFTTVQFGKCNPATDSTCVYLDLTGDKPQTAGKPLACQGPCKNMSADSQATQTGFNAVMNLFAISWGTYAMVDADKVATSSKIYTIENPGTTDQRVTQSTADKAPKVRGVNTTDCVGEVCKERASAGITITDSYGTTSHGSTGSDHIKTPSSAPGKLKVTLKYFGWADSDRMPIRRKVVDFYGGSYDDFKAVTVSNGYFKNHRGLATTDLDNDGILDDQLCGSDTTDWGLQPQACDNRYYEENRTYFCNSTILDQLKSCTSGPGGFSTVYPCKTGTTCVYRPRVQLMDNWQLCNGSCPGGIGSGDLCINGKYGDESDVDGPVHGTDECALGPDYEPFRDWDKSANRSLSDSSRVEPWTWFGAEIRVESD